MKTRSKSFEKFTGSQPGATQQQHNEKQQTTAVVQTQPVIKPLQIQTNGPANGPQQIRFSQMVQQNGPNQPNGPRLIKPAIRLSSVKTLGQIGKPKQITLNSSPIQVPFVSRK